jgi:hypothetical protein
MDKINLQHRVCQIDFISFRNSTADICQGHVGDVIVIVETTKSGICVTAPIRANASTRDNSTDVNYKLRIELLRISFQLDQRSRSVPLGYLELTSLSITENNCWNSF